MPSLLARLGFRSAPIATTSAAATADSRPEPSRTMFGDDSFESAPSKAPVVISPADCDTGADRSRLSQIEAALTSLAGVENKDFASSAHILTDAEFRAQMQRDGVTDPDAVAYAYNGELYVREGASDLTDGHELAHLYASSEWQNATDQRLDEAATEAIARALELPGLPNIDSRGADLLRERIPMDLLMAAYFGGDLGPLKEYVDENLGGMGTLSRTLNEAARISDQDLKVYDLAELQGINEGGSCRRTPDEENVDEDQG